MKFSIIVPVYNAEKYIDKLVQSVLAQTFNEYELILVDDGSKDNSYSLMKKYQSIDARIKAYTKENTGPGMTRKFGFEKAAGELLFFVDSDDWITTPNALEKINTLFEENPQMEVLFFDREDIIDNKRDVIYGFEEIDQGIHSIDEISEVIRPGLGAKILRRDILTSEMFYESTIFEDLYTTYAYLEKCEKFYYSPNCFYTIYHDNNSNSLSSTETAKSFAKSLEIILAIYSKTERRALKYSLELRMATLFTYYWKAKIRKVDGYDSYLVKHNIQKIIRILQENRVIIKPNGKKKIKVLIYKMLLFISGGNNE